MFVLFFFVLYPIIFCSFFYFYFYPIIKFICDNRQHELILDTRIAQYLAALALKMELVKFIFFVRFFFSCHILSCSLRGPATQPLHNEGQRPEFGERMDGWVVIIDPFWFSSFSSMITSNLRSFQKCAHKLHLLIK